MIEGIAVVHRQLGRGQQLPWGDFEDDEAFVLRGVHDRVEVGVEFADAELHRNLPQRGDADEDVVGWILGSAHACGGELRVVSEPPEQRVSVE